MLRDPFAVTWRERLLVLGTVVCLIVTAFSMGLTYWHEATVELLGLIPVSMVAAGKFLPLWGLGDSHFSPWELGLVIWALDTCTVLVVVYGLDALYSVRPLRRAMAKLQTNARLVLAAYPGIRRAAVIGVVLFVLFPVAGTGALVGAFLGILLGMRRLVLIVAISLGGLLGGMLMAFAAVYFGEAVQRLRTMQSDPLIKWLTIGLVVLVVALGFFWLNRMYQRAIEAARQDPEQQLS